MRFDGLPASTIRFVDALVERKKAKGAKPAELQANRAALLEKHGLRYDS